MLIGVSLDLLRAMHWLPRTVVVPVRVGDGVSIVWFVSKLGLLRSGELI